MKLRVGNILPNWENSILKTLVGDIQKILNIYISDSNPDLALKHLDGIIKNKFQQLESQPSLTLSIFLNSRYVLFSIYALKNKGPIKSLKTFNAINDIYKPFIQRIQQRYNTSVEDIEELLSHDFDSVQSLGFASLDYVGIGIFLLDKHFNFIYWSNGLENIFQIKAAEILGTSFSNKCAPFFVEERICDGVRLAIENGVNTDIISTRHPFMDNEDKFLNFIVAPIRNEKNVVIGASVLAHDITQRRKSEQTLAKYEQYFKNVLNDAADAIILLDENDCIVMWNKAAEILYGWREIEVLGEPVKIIVPDDPKSQKEIEKISRIIRKKGFVKNFRSERITRFGRRVIIEITRTAIKNDKGDYVGSSVITRDITKDEQLRDQIVQSEKLSAVGTLAAGIAHEIGSPLMSISSLAQMLQMDSEDNNLKDKLGLIQKSIERISRTVRTLVDFSKPTAQKVENIYLNQVVENVINIIRYDKRLKHQQIETEFDASIPLVKASFDQVLQVFINLCLNAADAMGNSKDGQLILRTWYEEPFVKASIQDNGCGIEESNLYHIFEPFYSTKEKGKGTGLGLWVSYNIIKSYGGDITVKSTRNVGTTFTISLPMAPLKKG
jgi:PAS domain S-box-containing protein